MRISDWSSDVCSSDLSIGIQDEFRHQHIDESAINRAPAFCFSATNSFVPGLVKAQSVPFLERVIELFVGVAKRIARICRRSEEHTSEIQSLMRISYAGFRLKTKRTKLQHK